MALNVTHYLNRTVFVSIPAIFEDGACRAYTLLGVEFNGLWLQSDELTQRLLPDGRKDLASLAPTVFVPFAQIAGVMIATSATPPPAQPEGTPAGAGAAAAPGPGPAHRGEAPVPPKQKSKKN